MLNTNYLAASGAAAGAAASAAGAASGAAAGAAASAAGAGEVVEVEEEGKVGMKEYPLVWREILAGMTDKKNTIPEIVANTKLAGELVTFHLMTMNRYGVVVPAGMDAKETYYYYKRK